MKKALFVLSVVVCLFIINSLVRSIFTLWQKQDVYIAKQEELKRVKKENSALKEQEKKVNDPQFAEKEIRNKLFLVKPQENVVILPTGMERGVLKQKEKKEAGEPPYQQWLALFLTGRLD